jgi:nitrate reductase gamma subunit
MSLLDFARGPAMQWSLIILVGGTLWRLLGVLLLTQGADFSTPRDTFGAFKGYRTVFSRSWPHSEFLVGVRYQTVMAYVFHLGLAIVVFGIVPHIEFIRGLTGYTWPGLPNNFGVAVSAVTLLALLAMIVRRVTDRAVCCSTWNDYFSWLVTVAPLVTGLMAYFHLGPRYETMLAIHILSAEVMFIWFPFGKLMHAVWVVLSRAQSGMVYARRGVRT